MGRQGGLSVLLFRGFGSTHRDGPECSGEPTALELAELEAFSPDPVCEVCGGSGVLTHEDGDKEPCV